MASSTKIKVPKINGIKESGSSGGISTASGRSNKNNLSELLGTLDKMRENQVLQLKAIKEGNNSNKKTLTELDKVNKELETSSRSYEKALTEYKKNLAELAILDRQVAGRNKSQIEKDTRESSRGISARRAQRRSYSNNSSFLGRSSGYSYRHSSSSWLPNKGITDVAMETGNKVADGFVPSLALSIATGGALNPVIIRAIWQPLKEVGGFIKDTLMLPIKILQGLWGSIKNIANVLQKVIGGVASTIGFVVKLPIKIVQGLFGMVMHPIKTVGNVLNFGGGLLGLGGPRHRDASAIDNANNSKLYKKLDNIIELLEKSNKAPLVQEEKKKSGFLSKILGFLGPMLKILAGLGAAFALFKGFQWLKNKYQGSWVQKGVQRLGKAWDNIKTGYQEGGLLGGAKAAWGEIKDIGKALWTSVSSWYEKSDLKLTVDEMVEKVKAWFSQQWEGVKTWWNEFDFFKFAGETVDAAVNIGKTIWGFVKDLWAKDAENEEQGKFSIHGMITKVSNWFSKQWQSIKDWWKDFSFFELAGEVAEGVADIGKGIWNYIGDLWAKDAENGEQEKLSIHGMIARVGDWFKSIWQGIKDWWNSWTIEGIARGIYNGAVELAEEAGGIASKIWDKIKEVTGGLWNGFTTAIGLDGFISKISEWFNSVWNGVKDWWNSWSFSGLISGAKDAVGKGVDKAVDVATEIGTMLDQAWESFDIMQTIKDGVTAIANKATAAFKAVVDWVKNLFSSDEIDEQINTEEELVKKRQEALQLANEEKLGFTQEEAETLLNGHRSHKLEQSKLNLAHHDWLYKANNGQIYRFDSKEDLSKFKNLEDEIAKAEAKLTKQAEDLTKGVEVNNGVVSLTDNKKSPEQREAVEKGNEYTTLGLKVYDLLLQLLQDKNFQDYFKVSIELTEEQNKVLKEQKPSNVTVNAGGQASTPKKSNVANK